MCRARAQLGYRFLDTFTGKNIFVSYERQTSIDFQFDSKERSLIVAGDGEAVVRQCLCVAEDINDDLTWDAKQRPKPIVGIRYRKKYEQVCLDRLNKRNGGRDC